MRLPTAQMKATVPVTLKRRMYRELRRQDLRFAAWLRMQMEAWLYANEVTPASVAKRRVHEATGEPIFFTYDVRDRLTAP